MVSLDRLLSVKIAGSIVFGTVLGLWIESSVPVLVALILGNPVTPVMLVTWLVWGLLIPPSAWLLLNWSAIETTTEELSKYVTEQHRDADRRTDTDTDATQHREAIAELGERRAEGDSEGA